MSHWFGRASRKSVLPWDRVFATQRTGQQLQELKGENGGHGLTIINLGWSLSAGLLLKKG